MTQKYALTMTGVCVCGREVMDSMYQPRNFPRVFTASYLYVFTLTLPSAATMFAAFPVLSAQHGQ